MFVILVLVTSSIIGRPFKKKNVFIGVAENLRHLLPLLCANDGKFSTSRRVQYLNDLAKVPIVFTIGDLEMKMYQCNGVKLCNSSKCFFQVLLYPIFHKYFALARE